MAIIGYARVSTGEQNLDLQLSALREAACERVFSDEGVSAVARSRPGFDAALASLQANDTLMVWKMDRAFRSVLHAASMLEEFALHRITLECITETIDTTSSMGRCMYHVRNAFSEWERDLISERTRAGLAVARKRGVKLGRPTALTQSQMNAIRREKAEKPGLTTEYFAHKYEVSIRTIGRIVQALERD